MDDDWWAQADFLHKLKNVNIPAFHQSGWFDGDGIGTKLNYLQMKEYGHANQKLTIGPWGHTDTASRKLGDRDFGPQAIIDLQRDYLRWFDYWLKGVDNGITKEPLVSIYVMGTNQWLHGNSYPLPETKFRKLYFSERPENPNDPNRPTTFYITLDGQTPKPFDPQSDVPDIVARQGDVEDWIIENRTTELHDFHIHQLHFQLREWSGVAVNEPFVRDTVSIPYYNGRALQYPSVRLRMDFRDPNIVGTFVYHCHLLEHEDGGMMGRIRVEPADTAVSTLSSRQFTRGEQYEQK